MIQKVLVVGAGTMGAQISLDCALAGCDVAVWDISDRALETISSRHKIWADWQIEKGLTTSEEVVKAAAGIRLCDDPFKAGSDVDIMIEAVVEDLEIKKKVFSQYDEICPSRTIFVTNTSTLLPRDMETSISRKALFSAFHFNWPKSVIEIMKGSATEDQVIEALADFARRIGYLPIFVKKEVPGYIHAALFGAWAITGVQLAAYGAASIEDIDRVWMRGDNAPLGPLAALDTVGLDLAHMILLNMGKAGIPGFDYETMLSFLGTYLEKGELGVKTGKGFYAYPNPTFKQSNFIK